ncbi:hypothetical protein GS506_15115 [Rhodococcus hoagii]|nr:hypothetical protein [Prescottella equi]
MMRLIELGGVSRGKGFSRWVEHPGSCGIAPRRPAAHVVREMRACRTPRGPPTTRDEPCRRLGPAG